VFTLWYEAREKSPVQLRRDHQLWVQRDPLKPPPHPPQGPPVFGMWAVACCVVMTKPLKLAAHPHWQSGFGKQDYRLYFRSRSAFAMTDTELKLMAAPAMMGLSRMPKKGYSTPAATGMPTVL
jgi:hypothetical protein